MAMTLGDLIDLYRPCLLDGTVGVQRSWEDTVKYTLKIFPRDTPLRAFDLDRLAAEMGASGMNPAFVNGYVDRWRRLIDQADELMASHKADFKD
ncbi:hypothetical protein [Aliirhizobium smilacinae]|uniref:Uncharacterized protein n=1 Tax=Aliirhizobium smilacinae TaxID=1395944 RepID=A0A5C4XRS2_9HYPH|nr:hypothetical protein [Rhizobium smilacinae]TNM65250.1 hypothetical protein FHP24_02915 [Rhizobium smilacinae]